jgi:hypothetical protein
MARRRSRTILGEGVRMTTTSEQVKDRQTPEVDGEREDELQTILQAISGLDGLIATNGLVDLSIVAPEDVTYRVPIAAGGTRDFAVPGDVPFPLALQFLRARDRFTAAEAAFGAAGDANEEEQDRHVEAISRTWAGLVASLTQILAIRQADIDAAAIAEIPNLATRNLVGAIWIRILGLRLRPFSQELADGGEAPKAGEPPSTPDGTEPASSS